MLSNAALFQSLLVITGWCLLTLWSYRQPLQNGLRQRMTADRLGTDTLVAYASEAGHASALARELWQQLRQQGTAARLLSLNQLHLHDLQPATQLLLVASTSGQGEAPLNGRHFARRLAASNSTLPCRFAVLALGDSRYRDFCAFGEQLYQRLSDLGARPLFDPVRVDQLNRDSIHQWWLQLAQQGVLQQTPQSGPAIPASATATFRLASRTQLNAGSSANGLFALDFTTSDPLPHWQAGDIAELQIQRGNETLYRQYSIASVMQEQRLSLMVRAQYHADGAPGAGSGLLCQQLLPGDQATFSIRSNPAFQPPADDRPLILIGSGSGLAGLRAHIRHHRYQQRRAPLWLIYGEREALSNSALHQAIQRWQQNTALQCDLAFSRARAPWPVDLPGTAHAGYVQDVLRQQADSVRRWLNDDAAIYVCGNRDGMAAGVDRELRAVVGDDLINQLEVDGRYRRDVY